MENKDLEKNSSINKIVEVLKDSGVILTPTDTTFGLSCLANDEVACHKINQIKNRQDDKNFILLVENDAHLQRLVEVPDLSWDIIDLSEKPVTIIYDKLLNIPPHLIAEDNTVAIRVVKHPLLQKLIHRLKAPIVSTSANVSGEAAPKNFNEISKEIIQKVDYILPECEDFVPEYQSSSIIKLSTSGKVQIIRN